MLDPTRFLLARNPDEESSLPYLLRLPLEYGLVLKARGDWLRSSRVYCHPAEWPADAEVAELAGLKTAAVVVEDRYSSLFKAEHVQPGWLAELAVGYEVRYPQVPIVYCESRKVAEEWAYRFLAAARRECGPEQIGLS